MKTCQTCQTEIPSTNTTGVCVACTYAAEPMEAKLARWDAIISEQQAIQLKGGITPAMLRAAAKAEELLTQDELEA